MNTRTFISSLLIFIIFSNLGIYGQLNIKEINGYSKTSSFAIMRDSLPIDKIPPYAFIKLYVEKKMEEWQKKGEFEKSSDYKARVTELTRTQKLQSLTDEAVVKYNTEFAKKVDWSRLQIGQYDADNETFLIKSEQFGDFAISVPIAEAPGLKENWNKVQFLETDFIISNNSMQLRKTKIYNTLNDKTYTYDSKNSTTYAANNIIYNFAPIEVDVPNEIHSAGGTRIENLSTSVGRDPVDIEIPVSSITESRMTFALIIGNENYKNEIKVPFAINDATIFSKYCKTTFRIPENNIKLLIDGTYGQMLGEIKWIKDVIKAYNGEASVILYYAGHGMPDEKDRSAYLLPSDGNSSIPQTAIKLDELYAGLTQNPARSVSVFLDACFSGAARDGSLSDGRGVRIPPKENLLNGNIMVFSATSSEETALPLTEKGHGMFTYYILKKFQETAGDVTMQDLITYVTSNVSKQSIVINNKVQNPKVSVSTSFQGSWQNLKLY